VNRNQIIAAAAVLLLGVWLASRRRNTGPPPAPTIVYQPSPQGWDQPLIQTGATDADVWAAAGGLGQVLIGTAGGIVKAGNR